MEVWFSGCSIHSWETTSVTDVGLRSLAALPNLVDLSMSYLANVSDVALQDIACRGRLRKLVCRGCPTFTDVGCSRYIILYQYLHLFVGIYPLINKLRNSKFTQKFIVFGT
jgi:hypothetical protein